MYLVEELMHGGDLQDYQIEATGPLSIADARVVIERLLRALVFLHELNLVHRDIKPENVMLERKGDLSSVKLGDFGFTRFVDRGTTTTSSRKLTAGKGTVSKRLIFGQAAMAAYSSSLPLLLKVCL